MWTSLVQTVSKTCQSASQKKRLHQGGLHEGYHLHKRHPEDADYSRMPPEEARAAMQREILYLRQELEFIKKIIKTDSTGGRKQ